MSQSATTVTRHDNTEVAVEYAVMLSLIVAAVFLGMELLGQSANRTVTFSSTSGDGFVSNITANSEYFTQYLQLASALGFVAVTTAFVARNMYRRQQLIAARIFPEHTSEDVENSLFDKRQELFRKLSHQDFVQSLQEFTVNRLMSPHVTAVRVTTPYAEVYRLMTEHRIHHVVVCDEQRKVLGVISDRDLLAKQVPTAKELMTANPVCINADTSILTLVTIMLEHRFSSLPVVSNEKLIGLVTTTDTMLALQCLLQVLHLKLLPAENTSQ
jgi:CBS domain-containing protein